MRDAIQDKLRQSYANDIRHNFAEQQSTIDIFLMGRIGMRVDRVAEFAECRVNHDSGHSRAIHGHTRAQEVLLDVCCSTEHTVHKVDLGIYNCHVYLPNEYTTMVTPGAVRLVLQLTLCDLCVNYDRHCRWFSVLRIILGGRVIPAFTFKLR